MPLARVVRSASRLAPVVLVLAWLLPARLVAEEIAVELDFFPREQSLRPLSEPVLFRITAIKGDGAPVPEGTVRVRLDAPRPPRFFSTDFPAVEGVRLLDMELPLRKGKTEWKYVFPIRGSYRLSVEATATGGGKANRVFQFRVREQERRLFFVTAGSLGLFLFGVVAGRILTTKGTRFPPGSVIVAITAGTLFAGEHAVRAREASGLVVDSAIVGQPARIHWSPGDAQQNRPVLLSLAVTHLEKQLVVFAVEKIPAAGGGFVRFVFSDAARYRITAASEPASGRTSYRERVVSVVAVDPDPRAAMPAILFFTALVAAGLAAGRWTKIRAG